ncbi:single-strand binding family protein [Prevotella amnii]|uniref:Single-stranded DNA-binding protein n=1 Tax=Prevotella amnii TaxID=419005 RepID=A0A134B5C4_9BACT|nr:single-stranded DNA-binding protein [Prevotella amnii]KXB75140.1 single-strand binding family protein [Prevotella amnii]
MKTKNAVSLIGMIGNDVEVRLANGVPYARFSLATSTGGYKKQDGTEVQEKTQWHNIVVWRHLADFAGKYIKKGMKVAVDGMITYGEYTNKDGQKVYTVEILANDIILMSMPQQRGQVQQQAQQGEYQEPFTPAAESNDLPF